MSIQDKFNDSNSESDADSFDFLEEPRIERSLKSPFDESIDSAFALLEHIITIKASVKAELDRLFFEEEELCLWEAGGCQERARIYGITGG